MSIMVGRIGSCWFGYRCHLPKRDLFQANRFDHVLGSINLRTWVVTNTRQVLPSPEGQPEQAPALLWTYPLERDRWLGQRVWAGWNRNVLGTDAQLRPPAIGQIRGKTGLNQDGRGGNGKKEKALGGNRGRFDLLESSRRKISQVEIS